MNGTNEAVDDLEAAREVDDTGGGFVVMDDDTFVTIDCTIPRDSSSMTLQFIGDAGKIYLNNDDGVCQYRVDVERFEFALELRPFVAE